MITQKPILPKYYEYIKYLKSIDKKRMYSNYGPLYFKTKKKIERYLKLKKKSVILTSSGDASLFACLKYLKYLNKNKKYILTPSFSFSSDIQSIINSGFEPIFIDINLENWTMSETEIYKEIKNNSKIAGILIVSPFGYPLNINNLNNLKSKTKIEIIYDAADTFLNLRNIEKINFFLTSSFHPTKNIAGNESGMIICKKLLEKNFKEILNFGQENKKKKIKIFGFNGKISEYDCAILLATLKNIIKIKEKIKKINRYIVKNTTNNLIIFQENIGINWFSNKINFYSKNLDKKKIKKIFIKKGIQLYEPWTGKPMHLHDFFKNYKKNNLRNTLFLSKKILSLPINFDISNKNLKKICDTLNILKKK
jgi:dTDP-4-amino-4,6-dideoxygalactose transaminase